MPEGVKWRGKSVYQVLERLREAGKAGEAAYQMKLATDERMARLKLEAAEILVGLADELKGFDPADLHLGVYWKCTYSPTDHCIYNTATDRWMNRCLFCAEPSDRG